MPRFMGGLRKELLRAGKAESGFGAVRSWKSFSIKGAVRESSTWGDDLGFTSAFSATPLPWLSAGLVVADEMKDPSRLGRPA